MKFYDFYNSKLKEVMRNLTCGVGVYQILLLVIRFVLTRVKTDFSWTCFSRCGGEVGGGEEYWRQLKPDILFWWIVVGRFKCGKMG